MSVDEGHVNQAEFPEAAVQQAREEYSADSDSFGEKDPFKLKKEKKDADKKKKEKGYKTFEAESFSEEDDERGKGKKRSSLFGKRFTPSAKTKPKEKDGRIEEGRTPRDKTSGQEKRFKGGGEEKKMKAGHEDKKRNKSKEREKTKKKSSADIPAVKQEPVFGVPLAGAVAKTKFYDNIELPRIVRECIDYVEEFGLRTQGVYRLSGVKSRVEALKAAYNNGEKVNLTEQDASTVTSLLKQYLRELPETVLTNALTPVFEHAAAWPKKEDRVGMFRKVLAQLPPCNHTLLAWMMVHQGHILELKHENNMTIQNLSIVMSPTMRISHRTLNILFVHWKDFFGNVKIKKCPKPLVWVPGTVFEIPDTTAELEEELLRHEAILAKMHEELNRGTADKSTEDQLWEVQRVVTQLKRTLRVSRRVSETRLAEKEKEMENKEPKVVTKETKPGAKETKPGAKDTKPGPKETKPGAKEIKVEDKDTKPGSKETKEVDKDTKSGAKETKPEVKEPQSPEKTKSPPPSTIKQEPTLPTEDSDTVIKEEPKEEKAEAEPAAAPQDQEDSSKVKEEAVEEELTIVEVEVVDKKEEEMERRTDSEEDTEDSEPDLEMMKLLLLSQAEVVAEREELMNIRQEIQKRLEAERAEIQRLQSAISEAKQAARRRGASVDSIDSSVASESSSESEDEEELQKILEGLIRENEELRRKNMQLSHNIHNEREACAELLVQIKLQEQMPQMMETLAQAGLRHKTKTSRENRSKAHPKEARTKGGSKESRQKTVAKEKKVVIETEQKVITREHPPKERPGSKDMTMKQKRGAIFAEPITERALDADIAAGAEFKNENTNSNASPEVIEDSTSIRSGEKTQRITDRQLEETAL